jgi:signal transduction histidine kinase
MTGKAVTHASPGATVAAVRSAGAERELALDDLTYLNRMTTVGQVLPNVAHELNNALQIVSGIVEILSLRPELPGDVRDKMTRIGLQSGRATTMLRELVTFTRRDDAGVALVDVMKIVDRTLALRRYHLARARIDAAVDAPAGPTLARLDGNHLQQILLNLVINAEQSLADRTDGRIRIAVSKTGETLEIRIIDNGRGIAEDLTSRVAEPFFTTRELAAGLGVPVSAGLALRLGGQLALRRGEPTGTEAVLSLPAA